MTKITFPHVRTIDPQLVADNLRKAADVTGWPRILRERLGCDDLAVMGLNIVDTPRRFG
jgi:hypothetical protein